MKPTASIPLVSCPAAERLMRRSTQARARAEAAETWACASARIGPSCASCRIADHRTIKESRPTPRQAPNDVRERQRLEVGRADDRPAPKVPEFGQDASA